MVLTVMSGPLPSEVVGSVDSSVCEFLDVRLEVAGADTQDHPARHSVAQHSLRILVRMNSRPTRQADEFRATLAHHRQTTGGDTALLEAGDGEPDVLTQHTERKVLRQADGVVDPVLQVRRDRACHIANRRNAVSDALKDFAAQRHSGCEKRPADAEQLPGKTLDDVHDRLDDGDCDALQVAEPVPDRGPQLGDSLGTEREHSAGQLRDPQKNALGDPACKGQNLRGVLDDSAPQSLESIQAEFPQLPGQADVPLEEVDDEFARRLHHDRRVLDESLAQRLESLPTEFQHLGGQLRETLENPHEESAKPRKDLRHGCLESDTETLEREESPLQESSGSEERDEQAEQALQQRNDATRNLLQALPHHAPIEGEQADQQSDKPGDDMA